MVKAAWNTPPLGKPSVHLDGAVLEADAWHRGDLFLGLHLLFSFFQWSQHLPIYHCLHMHSDQETHTKVWSMFKFLGIKIPPYHFPLTLWVPLTLDSLRSLSWCHTDPFSLPYDPSLPRQEAAREEARTFNRLSISDPMFFSSMGNGEQSSLQGCQLIGLKRILLNIMCGPGALSMLATLWVKCVLLLGNWIIKERMLSFYCLKHESSLNATNLKSICTLHQNYAKW